MADIREDIMVRLTEISAGVEGIVRVGRNVIELSDRKFPAIFVLEGDEEADDNDPIRVPTSRRRVMMTPHLVIVQGAAVVDIGPDLNTLRRLLIEAVTTDATLAALTLNSRGVRYLGMESDLAFGRQMQGQMAVKFGLTYILEPSDL